MSVMREETGRWLEGRVRELARGGEAGLDVGEAARRMQGAALLDDWLRFRWSGGHRRRRTANGERRTETTNKNRKERQL